MNPGTRVRMSAALITRLLGTCKHATVEDSAECVKCSMGHAVEFRGCHGIVQGPTDYNNVKPGEVGYDTAKVGPEVDVRWLPSNLRYAYNPDDLEAV